MIYDVPAVDTDGFAQVELPADEHRMGFLGLHSHPVSTSATARGYFLRTALLCGEVPDPPSNVDTSLPPPEGEVRTLRERLERHRNDPQCKGCHKLTDVPGLGFENFDGIGRCRLLDNGGQVEPSGELDGQTFADFRGLVLAVANHPDAMPCVAEKLYAYAVAHAPSVSERDMVAGIHGSFAASGYTFRSLIKAVAMSEGFRRPAAFDASIEP